MIPITRFVEPDLTFIVKRLKYEDKYEWFKFMYSFSENMCLMCKCHEDGTIITDSWESFIEYIACKLDGDKILFVDPKIGWKIDSLATEKYAHVLADKELLR